MKKLDLSGQRFSRLLVIDAAPSRRQLNGSLHAFWVCRCDCGKEKEIRGQELVRGKTRSCGCFMRENQSALRLRRGGHPARIDLVGMRFLRLLVLQAAPPRTLSSGRVVDFWRCRCVCGNEKEIAASNLRNGTTRSCGCLRREPALNRRGDRSSNWRGGRYLSRGYVVLINPVFPGWEAYSRGGPSYRTLEHVVVMARHIGRPLTDKETVHHKNGVRDDNRIENLELWTSNHPAGQRTEDLVSWAKNILEKYGVGDPPKIISPCCV